MVFVNEKQKYEIIFVNLNFPILKSIFIYIHF